MSYEFRPAKRENVTLILGVAGPSGGGKTYSAMRLAKGMAGGKRFAVIDTEARRALHYADQFEFDHVDLLPPFKPSAFEAAIKAAAAYPVVVVDNFSHEWSGEGGILDMQEAELMEKVQRAQKSGDSRSEWQLHEVYKMSSWIRAKTEHKHMVQRLLQSRAHLILCLRAEDKIDMVKDPATGKMAIVPKQTLSGFKGWIPICEKNLLFELTASFILTPDKPGVPQPIKLQEQHRKVIDLTKPLDEKAGELLAAWAKGGAGRPVATGAEAIPAPAAPESTGGSLVPPDPAKAEKPKGPGIPGIDEPDERQAIVLLIDAEKAKLERQPTPEVWDKICEDLCGTTTLDLADPAALHDLLALVKGLLAKDRDAVQRTRRIMSGTAA
jgi:hypothetical protein